MILGFLPNRSFTLQELEQITAKRQDKASWEVPFAIWLVDHGFELQHMTTFDFRAFKNEGIAYIRRIYGQEIGAWQGDN